VHEALQKAVDLLEAIGRLALAQPSEIANAVEGALKTIAKTWESEQPVPPPVVWRNTLETARQVSSSARFTPAGSTNPIFCCPSYGPDWCDCGCPRSSSRQ